MLWAQLGDISRAEELALALGPDVEVIRALANASVGARSVDLAEEADRLAHDALERFRQARLVDNAFDNHRTYALADLVRAYTHASDWKGVQRLVRLASKDTRGILGQALEDLIDTLVRGRKLAVAEEIARVIKDPGERNRAFARIAEASILDGDANSAIRLVEGIGDATVRVRALGAVSRILSQTDMHVAAGLMREAEVTARKIQHFWPRVMALADVAEAMATIEPDTSDRLASEVEECTPRMMPESTRGFAAVALIAIALKRQRFGRIRELMNLCPEANGRSYAAALTVNMLLNIGRFREASSIAKLIEEPYQQAKAYHALSRALTLQQSGKPQCVWQQP
ncbi:hypothetical protein Rhe02_09280 [Rhizocola hellebori]|uniref:Uncharacterized protein n=2 Tax=Rhizocola hellebori TaxID=1392758 RepID=A0A8J3VDZ3_9ACTN|nr:hypothetical protein Rhe02_09280 [Rhizocola hellebori]